jgi:hypothetical protein
MNLHEQIWKTFSAIDVSGHVEKKNGLDYLSWAFAIQKLNEHFPNNSYGFTETAVEGGTMMTEVMMTITVGNETAMRTMWLPVMDYRNKAIPNPDAFAINTSRMRCLTKCLAMWGLGLSLYSKVELTGEPEPPKKRVNKEQKQLYVTAFLDALETEDALALKELGDELKEDEAMMSEVWKEFSSKQKAEIKKILDTLRKHTL